jgi:DNA helicase-2/ATP-dependent DNA helicase PcrA
LEFDAVFITGLEEGLFPHENALSDHQGVEEERRLMYVAITRARKRLYLSHSQTRMLHGQTRYNIRSRFFDELPEHTLKWLSVAAKGLNPASAWGSSRKHDTVAASTDWTSAISPPSPASASGANAWVRAGVPVFHNKFGEGVVLAIEGSGEDARAQVKFGRHGVKWLALSVAKLTPV